MPVNQAYLTVRASRRKAESDKPATNDVNTALQGQPVGHYVADLVVDGQIILELKAVSSLTKAHQAQAHHYLAATGLRLAILINLSGESLQQKRIVR